MFIATKAVNAVLSRILDLACLIDSESFGNKNVGSQQTCSSASSSSTSVNVGTIRGSNARNYVVKALCTMTDRIVRCEGTWLLHSKYISYMPHLTVFYGLLLMKLNHS
jgi:hypothetical protein